MSTTPLSNRCLLLLVAALVMVAAGCASSTTIAEVAQETSGLTNGEPATEPPSVEVVQAEPGSTGEPELGLGLGQEPTTELVSPPEPDPTPEPTATAEPASTPEAAEAVATGEPRFNRPIADRIVALASIEDVEMDPKRVADGVSLDSTWWGLDADVYSGGATPAEPIPEIGDRTAFCDEGHLIGSPQSTNRAARDWSAETVEYRSIEVRTAAMLSATDAANSVQRFQLLLENCAGVTFAGLTMDVVDGQYGQVLVMSSDDSDFALVTTTFSAGSLVVDVSAAGDLSLLEQLVADVDYALPAAVDAVERELGRLGAVAELKPELQDDLARLDDFCRGHNQWETSTGLTRPPLEYFENVVGYFDGVEAPEEISVDFEIFHFVNSEMLDIVRMEPNMAEDELGEHPAWIELRDSSNFTESMTAVWDFGRDNC